MSERKRILVTAGNTYVPIDQVRGITNIFKGRTGTEIALHLTKKKYEVILLTSNPDLVWKLKAPFLPPFLFKFLVYIKLIKIPKVIYYRTYDDLMEEMERLIKSDNYDAIVHSSAVSDYFVAGACLPTEAGGLINIPNDGKIGSDHIRLLLDLSQTEKIIDKIRRDWGFKKILVKFKLQVDMSDQELCDVAFNSMKHSQADVIVANCLEWAKERAFIIRELRYGPNVTAVSRNDLPGSLEYNLKYLFSKRKGEES